MGYLISLTPAQVAAIANWVYDGLVHDHPANVELDERWVPDSHELASIVVDVAQGDDRTSFRQDGSVFE